MKLITIEHDGLTSKVEAHGFIGSACEAATAAIEAALGGMTDRQEKPEYWQTVEEQNQQEVQQ